MTLAKAVTRTLDVDVDDVRIDLTATIKSYDLTDTKFIFDIQSSQGLTINLMGGTAMYIVEYVHNSQTYAIQGNIDIINSTKISFNLPSDLKGYKGTVLIGLYVQMADGTKIDIKDIAVRIEPSIMDKDIDFSARTYFEDFETVKAEVTLKGEQAKTSINAVVSDVQSTGNVAKTQIANVLPSVQSKVSAINTELAKIDENMPDLFVAYADDSQGSGFSKTDNSKLYKGYGVKNSTNPADYRWERNVEDLSTGGDNLIINGGFPTDTHGWTKSANVAFSVGRHQFYFNGNKNLFSVTSIVPDESFIRSDRFKVKRNTDYTISFIGFSGSNVRSIDVFFLGRKNGETSDYTINRQPINAWHLSDGSAEFYKATFNTGDSDEGYIRFDHNGSTDGQVAYMLFGEVMLIEGTVAKKYQPSSADLMLKSNPINSILTTLSQENPSTALGGTWVQLGTETKFNNTIYYWQRTQ